MVHPGWQDELELLLSKEWRLAIRDLPLGSFAELHGPRPSASTVEFVAVRATNSTLGVDHTL